MDKKTPSKKKPAKKNTTRNKVTTTKSKTTTTPRTRRTSKSKVVKEVAKPQVKVIKARKVAAKKTEPKKKTIVRSKKRATPSSAARNEVKAKPVHQKNEVQKETPRIQEEVVRKVEVVKEKSNNTHTSKSAPNRKSAPNKSQEVKEKANNNRPPNPTSNNNTNTSNNKKATQTNNTIQNNNNNESAVTINQNVAVLIDGNNIEKSIHSLFNRKSAMLDFDNIIPKLLRNRGLNRLIYFREGLHISSKLAERLHKNYFGTVVPCHKSADIPLSITATQLAEKVDTIIILSGDSDYVDLVRHLRSRGVRVEIAAIKQTTAKILIDEADFFTEITKTDCYVR